MFNSVKEFHEVFGAEVNVPPSHNNLKLRFDLIEEEFKEVAEELATLDLQISKAANEGAKTKTKARLTKELADLMYVTLGTAVTLGLPIVEGFNEVHRSNMSKLNADGNVIRREDGKVLKSDRYTPANMDQFFG